MISSKIKLMILNSQIGFFFYKILVHSRRIFHKKKKFLLEKKNNFFLIGEKDYQTFTGYYDINLISPDEEYVLYHRKKNNKNYVEIILKNINSKDSYEVLDQSKAWSWQMGSRLQWLEDNKVFYNIVNSDDILNGVIFDVRNKKKKIINYPIFSISKDYKKGLILNFKKLEQQRKGYGYNFKQISENENENEILIFDFDKNKIIKKYNLEKINSMLPAKDYYFNHLSWAPNHHSFIAYVVRTNPRKTILYFFKDFEKIIEIDLIDQISHHEWLNSNEIIFYGEIKGKKNFYTFNLESMKYQEIEHEYSSIDGHLNSKNYKTFIVDTYPDKYHDRHLYTYNINKKKMDKLGNFFSHMDFRNDKKCDLHPKYSKNHKYFLIDTSHNRFRQIMLVENRE